MQFNHDWACLPGEIFLEVATHLLVRDVLNMGAACQNWHDLAQDDYLWKQLFRRDFKVDRNIGLRPG